MRIVISLAIIAAPLIAFAGDQKPSEPILLDPIVISAPAPTPEEIRLAEQSSDVGIEVKASSDNHDPKIEVSTKTHSGVDYR